MTARSAGRRPSAHDLAARHQQTERAYLGRGGDGGVSARRGSSSRGSVSTTHTTHTTHARARDAAGPASRKTKPRGELDGGEPAASAAASGARLPADGEAVTRRVTGARRRASGPTRAAVAGSQPKPQPKSQVHAPVRQFQSRPSGRQRALIPVVGDAKANLSYEPDSMFEAAPPEEDAPGATALDLFDAPVRLGAFHACSRVWGHLVCVCVCVCGGGGGGGGVGN